MSVRLQNTIWRLLAGIVCCYMFPVSSAEPAQAPAQALNPNFFYFIAGEVIGGRGFSVSDPDDWGGVALKDKQGNSKGSKVKVKGEDYQGDKDALRVQFTSKKKKGSLSLYGGDTDLSAVKEAAALAFHIKVNRKPNSSVKVGLDCTYPCRAEVDVTRQLRSLEKGQWSTFSIALNCFQSDNFDLSKINGVFLLSTEGKMDISVANIRVERLPAGETGCTGGA